MRAPLQLVVLALLPTLTLSGVFSYPPDEEGCSFSWRSLGCTPSKECQLQFKPRPGTFGPCVKRKAKAAAKPAEPAKPAAAKPAAAKPAAAKPAAAKPAAEPAAEPAEAEPAADEPEADSKDEP